MARTSVPTVKLNNGKTIPILGLGTWNVASILRYAKKDALLMFKIDGSFAQSPTGEVAQAVKDAIDAGYRHIDGAFIYGNEQELGEGLNQKIAEGVIRREDMFITSKLWNTFHRPDLVRGAIKASLRNLATPYVDLYLIHWPLAYKEGDDLFPKDPTTDAILFSGVDYLDTWKELEKAVDDGLVKSIGVSNFNRGQLERLLAVARIKPVINQVECHPYLTQQKLSAYCATQGIVITAYSPLGSPQRPWVTANDAVLLEDPKLMALAAKYGRTVGQLLIRYQTQRGHVVIPKSVTESRIIANLDVFGFKLTAEDLALVTSFDCDGRICPMTGSESHPNYPFPAEF